MGLMDVISKLEPFIFVMPSMMAGMESGMWSGENVCIGKVTGTQDILTISREFA